MLDANPQNFPSDWSDDGNYVLFDGDVHLRRGALGKWEKLANPYPGRAGTLSPDSRFVAFVSGDSGRWEVNVQTFPEPSRKWHISPGGGAQPRWNRNGKELFYVQGDPSVPTWLRHFSFLN